MFRVWGSHGLCCDGLALRLVVPKPAEQHWRLRVAAGQETLCVLAGSGPGPGASPESEKFSYSKASLATGGLEDCVRAWPNSTSCSL